MTGANWPRDGPRRRGLHERGVSYVHRPRVIPRSALVPKGNQRRSAWGVKDVVRGKDGSLHGIYDGITEAAGRREIEGSAGAGPLRSRQARRSRRDRSREGRAAPAVWPRTWLGRERRRLACLVRAWDGPVRPGIPECEGSVGPSLHQHMTPAAGPDGGRSDTVRQECQEDSRRKANTVPGTMPPHGIMNSCVTTAGGAPSRTAPARTSRSPHPR
jgi:hypothetical protein